MSEAPRTPPQRIRTLTTPPPIIRERMRPIRTTEGRHTLIFSKKQKTDEMEVDSDLNSRQSMKMDVE